MRQSRQFANAETRSNGTWCTQFKREIPDFNYTSRAVSGSKLRTRDRKRHHIDSRVSLSLPPSLFLFVRGYFTKIFAHPKRKTEDVLYRFPFTSPFLSDKKTRVWRTRIDIFHSIPDAIRRLAIVLPEIRCSRVSTGSVVSQQTVGHTRNSTVFPHREQNFSSLSRRNEDPEEVTFIRTAAVAASQPNRERRSSSGERKIKTWILLTKETLTLQFLRIFFCLAHVN